MRITADQYCPNCHADVAAGRGIIKRKPVCMVCGHKTAHRKSLKARHDRKKQEQK